MALIKCNDCGKDMSKKASACPSCGAPPKKKAPGLRLIGLILIAGIVIQVAFEMNNSRAPQSEVINAPQKKEPSKRDIQLQIAGIGALHLKKSMKDPEAFELKSALVMPNGSACYEYRAKNSFGAMFPGNAVLTVDGKILIQERSGAVFVKTWNKECTIAGGTEIAATLKRLSVF